MAHKVTNWRRRKKEELVALFDGVCHDCGAVFPPFVFQFDHRDPSTKSFGISGGGVTRSWESMLLEAQKCDMVCANCHAVRTHKQRCAGCHHCD